MKQTMIEAGKVRNTHALRGEVKFECWLGEEIRLTPGMVLYSSPKGENGRKIRSVRASGEVLLLGFEGVDSPESAQILKGKVLYASRREIDPRDEKIFFADLMGLPIVEAESGKVHGTVTDVSDRGAGELLHVRKADGKEAYFPMVREWIVSMDPEKGIFVRTPEGLFD